MKKYILLISLCCFAFLQSEAITEMIESMPQDTIRIYKGKKNLDGSNVIVIPNFEEYTVDPDAFDFDFDIDTSQLLAMKENFKNMESFDFGELKENLKANKENLSKQVRIYNYNYNFGNPDGFSVEQKGGNPKQIDNKKFSNISGIDFSHQYGNIVIRESKSKNVELEIQYFGDYIQKSAVVSSVKDGQLTIRSKSSGANPINFIVNIPRNTKLNINLRYGKVKMNNFQSQFTADLSYSTLDAEEFSAIKPVIKDRYGKVTIDKLQDIDLSASYSKVRIGKVNRLDVSGAYSDFVVDDVRTISTGQKSMSGEFKVGTLGDMDGKFNYADISVDKLQSGMRISCNYSDIKIKSFSQKSSVSVKGNYSDVVLNIPDNMSASFDIQLGQGDLDVSNKHKVKYSEQSSTSSRMVKKGRIGSKTPTITIGISGNYGDVKIR
ncbi:hypothetical protein D0T84_11950 [Dysgonomonas sp. 521]|uniref:DUF4097 family beta strand repeat-containing protein n=1 Tax=Dysgonomonas sp. 521 TaxID=2302932 RepID=UPI0013D4D91B|nr:DUF4097 family beta strand repeat-containing protein [Dysgonomonas sp. 521]NDV95619.1 hypothetical protein [Dysgonomonas sp. 521]